MNRARFINHKGKDIYLLDFSHATLEDICQTIDDAGKDIHSQPHKSVMTLTYATGGKFDTPTMLKLKNLTKANEPYVKAAAVVGVTGLQNVVMNAVAMFTKRRFYMFDDLEEAKEFLVNLED